MNDLISKALQSKLSKVGNIKIHQLDTNQGIKSGTLYEVKPSYPFVMNTKEILGANGKYTYETSEPKPFNMANILLINKYRNRDTGEMVEERVPALAINLKSTEQTEDNKIKYCSMLFRGTSFERLMDEIINASKTGSSLDRAKALYSIITSNGLTVQTFFEHLSEGNSIDFAQYKRGSRNMNFVDTKYYTEKVEQDVKGDDTI